MCDLAYSLTDRTSGCWGKEHLCRLPAQPECCSAFYTQPSSSVNPERLAWGSPRLSLWLLWTHCLASS